MEMKSEVKKCVKSSLLCVWGGWGGVVGIVEIQ